MSLAWSRNRLVGDQPAGGESVAMSRVQHRDGAAAAATGARSGDEPEVLLLGS